MRPVTGPAASAWMAVALVCLTGCASGVRPQRPATGSLTVGVTTTGGAQTSTSFRVTVEPAGIAGPVKANAGVFTSDNIPPGDHVVRLADVPAACQIDGGPERKITISTDRRFVVLRFDVRCK